MTLTPEQQIAVAVLKEASLIMRPNAGDPIDGDTIYKNLIADALVAEVVHRVGHWPEMTDEGGT